MLANIVSFWSGPVSYLERLFGTSMHAQGNPVAVYSYSPELIEAASLPVEVRDARTVLPLDGEVQRIARAKPAVVADMFRLELMRRGLGVWLDLDIVQVAPLLKPAAPIFAVEGTKGKINNAALYLPQDSPLLAEMLRFVGTRPVMAPWWTGKRRLKHSIAGMIGRPIPPENCQWGVFGPKALTWYVDQCGLRTQASGPETFYPVAWDDRADLVENTDISARITAGTIGVHLWANGLRKLIAEQGIHRQSFLAKTAEKYGVELPADKLLGIDGH